MPVNCCDQNRWVQKSTAEKMFLNQFAVFDILSQRTSHRHYLPFQSFPAPSLRQLLFNSSTQTNVLTPKGHASEATCQIDRSSYYRYLEMHAHLRRDLRKEHDNGREMRNPEFGFSYSTQYLQQCPTVQPPSPLRPTNWSMVESAGQGNGSEQRRDPKGLHEATRARPGKKIFGCRRCSYVTDRKNNLKRHVMAMHRKCERLLDCCGQAFDSKAALRDHVMAHHDNGYACLFCRRNFCRKALLKRHLAVHDGRKDYACADCGYATSHKSNLERHKKVHQSLQLQNWTPSSNVLVTVPEDKHQEQDGSRYCNSPRKVIRITNDVGNSNSDDDDDNEYIDVGF